MIHADANVLVALSVLLRAEPTEFERRLRKKEPVTASAPAWFEFVCGPVTEADLDMAQEFLGGKVVSLTREHADRAAVLFNVTGRGRVSKTDCLIAAIAIADGADLATLNPADFKRFEPFGLRLVEV